MLVLRPLRFPRSGFTLLEMAIIVVVIGLLVFGAITGSDMIESLKLKKDLRAYENLRNSLSLYLQTVGVPGDDNHDGIVQGRETASAYNQLVHVAGVDPRSFEFKFTQNLYYSFTECEPVTNGYEVRYWMSPTKTCLFLSSLHPSEVDSDNDADPPGASDRLFCIFEVGFDDKNVYTGNIRRVEPGSRFGDDFNDEIASFTSAFDCLGLSDESVGDWRNSIIIGVDG